MAHATTLRLPMAFPGDGGLLALMEEELPLTRFGLSIPTPTRPAPLPAPAGITLPERTVRALRAAAGKLRQSVEGRRQPRLTNTRKRAEEARQQLAEADREEAVVLALEAIAAAGEAGTLPELLQKFTTKAAVETLTRYSSLPGWEPNRGQMVRAGLGTEERFQEGKQTLSELLASSGSQSTLSPKARRLRELELKLATFQGPGWFPTPPAVIERLLEWAEIQDGMRVLEPSAGHGPIADAIRERYPKCELHLVERSHTLVEVLRAKGYDPCQIDFLEFAENLASELFDRVVMNPPFENLQDADHIRHAFSLLRPGGILVSVTGRGLWTNSQRKAREFRDWCEALGAHRFDLPSGSFAQALRSTNVETSVVVLRKVRGAE